MDVITAKMILDANNAIQDIILSKANAEIADGFANNA